MIYLTGDCHGNFNRLTKKQRSKLQFNLTSNDYVIVCGDLGLLWSENRELEYNIKWMSNLPFALLWIQGNHENYNMIKEYPLAEWHGGKVRNIISDKVILLERGQIFNIEGKSFFTFGGASSHDIEDGILDTNSPTFKKDKKNADKNKLLYRILDKTWWKEELPNEKEINEARRNLIEVENKVDYIITHCGSSSLQNKLNQFKCSQSDDKRIYKSDILTDFFEEIENKVNFKHWYLGHYHKEMAFDDKHTILYKHIIQIE